MTGTKNDRDMTGVLYGGVWEKRAGKRIITTTVFFLKLIVNVDDIVIDDGDVTYIEGVCVEETEIFGGR